MVRDLEDDLPLEAVAATVTGSSTRFSSELTAATSGLCLCLVLRRLLVLSLALALVDVATEGGCVVSGAVAAVVLGSAKEALDLLLFLTLSLLLLTAVVSALVLVL